VAVVQPPVVCAIIRAVAPERTREPPSSARPPLFFDEIPARRTRGPLWIVRYVAVLWARFQSADSARYCLPSLRPFKWSGAQGTAFEFG